MSRYERATYFNRLLELRAAYETRDVVDRVAVMSIADAVSFAERVLAVAAAAVTDHTATAAHPGRQS